MPVRPLLTDLPSPHAAAAVPAHPRQIGGGQNELAAAVDRLNEVVQKMRAMLAEIRQEIAEDRRTLEAKYLPRVEFTLTQATDAVQIRGIESEIHSLAKRQEAQAVTVTENEPAASTRIKQVEDTAVARIKEVEDRRRADRVLLLSGLAFPFIMLLLAAVLLSGKF